MSICFGLCIPSTMALAIPNPPEDEEDWWINFYWRIIWLVGLLIALIHTLLIIFCFNHETPVYLLQHGEDKKLNDVMMKFYKPAEVKVRIASLKASMSDKNDSKISYRETFCDPMYRKASWVGITLGTITSFTGIHSIVFYSGLLFEPDFRTKGSAIIWIMNFFASGIGLSLLNFFGRKTLLLTM